MKKFTHTYVFVAVTEHFPSIKLESDNLPNACTYFVSQYAQLEKDFEADEGKEPDSAILKVHPNQEIIRMLKLEKNKSYSFIVLEEGKFKQISPEFYKQFDY